MYACGRNQSVSGVGGDEHVHSEEAVELITLFSDSSEFYIEYPELMAGHKEAFLVHLTRLSSYKPYSEGSVRVSLDYGDSQSTGLAESPESPGIWRVLVRPENPGYCKIIFEYFHGNINDKTVFETGYVSDHDHAATKVHEGQQEGEYEEDPGNEIPEGIRFTKEQAWKSDFSVEKLIPSSFSEIIKTGGEILAMPGEKHMIHARASGIVNYSKKNLVAGDHVRRGQELMRIEGQDLAGENITVIYAEAEASFLKSRRDFQRHKKLFAEDAISEKQFIDTRSAYIRDSIHYSNLQQSFTGDGLKVIAPLTGHIHEIDVSQGEYVQEGQKIAIMSSDKRLLLRADVPQQYFPRISKVVSANIRTSYQDNVIDIKDIDGELIAIGSSVHHNNHYLPVYFEAHNNGDLLEGAYAEFYLKTSPLENCILLPVSSVLEEQGSYYAYVQTSGETYHKRTIKPGEFDGLYYLIISGLTEGERVVTSGGMLLKAASMSNSLPGHSHAH